MRVLIFGTTYIDDKQKQDLADKWWKLHSSLNPKCDLMFVDSASPLLPTGPVHILQMNNNIGHLGGRVGGSVGNKDGWGRAFCAGLRYAIENFYDYVVHVEGDSLCRLDIMRVCTQMMHSDVRVLSVPVRGTGAQERDWVETGLMFFDVNYVRESGLIGEYDWRDCEPKRKYPHVPEWHLCRILGDDLVWAEWITIRDDKHVIGQVQGYDWLTHARPQVYDAFFEHNMPKVNA